MSVNKVILVGHCCKDAETRYMPNGEAVTNINLATNEQWKDKEGKKQERAEFHHLVFYRRLAEIAGEYLKKGALIYVEGRIQTRKYQDKESGADRYTTEIIVNEMKMLGSKSDGTNSHSAPISDSAIHPGTPQGETYTKGGLRADAPKIDDKFEDDIPF